MITKIPVEKEKAKWLEQRANTIGGSEAGTILGMNDYQSAYGLWAEKTGKTAPFTGNLATEVGTYLEPFVAKKFEEETGLKVQRSNFIWFNSDYPKQHASPDRLIPSQHAGLEIKTTSAWNNAKFKDGQFPIQYYAQCVQYMCVTGYPIWYLAVLVGNQGFHIYMLRDNEDIPVPSWVEGSLVVDQEDRKALKEACESFWDCVARDIPPMVDGSDDCTDTLQEIFTAEEGTTMRLYCNPTIEKLLDVKKQIEELKEVQQDIENQLKAEMGNTETAYCGKWRISWKEQNRSQVDTKRLRADLPEVALRYTKTYTVRTFSVKEDK